MGSCYSSRVQETAIIVSPQQTIAFPVPVPVPVLHRPHRKTVALAPAQQQWAGIQDPDSVSAISGSVNDDHGTGTLLPFSGFPCVDSHLSTRHSNDLLSQALVKLPHCPDRAAKKRLDCESHEISSKAY